MELKQLTEKQSNVLDFIKKYSADHGYPPSIREIGQGLGLSSPATVHTHVKKLCNAGYLKVDNNKFRAMEILVDNEYEEKNEELIKVHFHTNEPWEVLEYCASLGEIYDIVIEDMDRQARGLKG